MFSRYLVHLNSTPIPRLLISRLIYYQYALIYYFFGKFTESSRCLKDETVVAVGAISQFKVDRLQIILVAKNIYISTRRDCSSVV